jgi:hypothetical protein
MLNSQADGQIGNRERGRSDQRRAARRDVRAQIRIERKVSKRGTPDKLYGNGVGIVIASRLPDIEGYVGCVKGRTASGKGGVQGSTRTSKKEPEVAARQSLRVVTYQDNPRAVNTSVFSRPTHGCNTYCTCVVAAAATARRHNRKCPSQIAAV